VEQLSGYVSRYNRQNNNTKEEEEEEEEKEKEHRYKPENSP